MLATRTYGPGWRLTFRVALALLSGLVSSLAFPRENLSPLIFVSTAMLLFALRGQSVKASAAIGFFGGLAFYLSQIDWLTLYLGPVPWLALGTLEAIIFSGGCVAIAQVWNWLDGRLHQSNSYKTLAIGAAIATIWFAREWVSITLPYGGFPWSRLGQTQSETILARWVFVGGIGFLSFLIALVSALVVIWLLEVTNRKISLDTPALITTVLIIFFPILLNVPVNSEAGKIKLAAVQGNANAGLFANPDRGSILDNHLSASAKLVGRKLDLVVWPENASDLSPFSDSLANEKITSFVNEQIKAPLVFGTITSRGSEIYNSSILWMPGVGPIDYYDKKRPVPFAEYVPNRDFWYSLAPDLVGLISRGYSFGTRDGLFELQKAKLGVLICFEIAIDDIGRDLVDQGAQIIISQTNNADFGRSDETFQQAAIAKLRAIETGRVVVNDSTVGLSAIFMPDGTTLRQLPTFEPGVLIAKLPLSNARTPAMVIGRYLDLSLNFAALVLVLLSILGRRRKNK